MKREISITASGEDRVQKITAYLKIINFLYNLTPGQIDLVSNLIDSDPINPISKKARVEASRRLKLSSAAINTQIHAIKKIGGLTSSDSGRAVGLSPVLNPIVIDAFGKDKIVTSVNVVMDEEQEY